MIKTTFLTAVKFVLFFAVFLWGSVKPPFGMIHILSVTRDGTHAFYWDGVILMTVLFVLILFVEAIRKRIIKSAPWTLLAFLLALGVAAELHFMAFTH